MFNERSALENIFKSLNQARERRHEQYLAEMKVIEEKENRLLSDLRRIDEMTGIHTEIIAAKKEAAAVTVETKKHLATMTQDLVAPLTDKERQYGVEKPEPKQPLKQIQRPIFEDGKKIWSDGTTTYQCFYVCPTCKDRGKQFVKTSSLETYCKSCSKRMKTKHATSKGFPNQDSFGNYFIAGDFVRVEDKPLIEPNPVDNVLAKYEAERSQTAIAAAFKESAKFNLG